MIPLVVNHTGGQTMQACEYFSEIDQQIEELEAALAAAVAGDVQEDPSELRAEIARLQRLAD